MRLGRGFGFITSPISNPKFSKLQLWAHLTPHCSGGISLSSLLTAPATLHGFAVARVRAARCGLCALTVSQSRVLVEDQRVVFARHGGPRAFGRLVRRAQGAPRAGRGGKAARTARLGRLWGCGPVAVWWPLGQSVVRGACCYSCKPARSVRLLLGFVWSCTRPARPPNPVPEQRDTMIIRQGLLLAKSLKLCRSCGLRGCAHYVSWAWGTRCRFRKK